MKAQINASYENITSYNDVFFNIKILKNIVGEVQKVGIEGCSSEMWVNW